MPFHYRQLFTSSCKNARYYAEIPMREIIKQERNFVANEMVASILITENLAKLDNASPEDAKEEGIFTKTYNF